MKLTIFFFSNKPNVTWYFFHWFLYFSKTKCKNWLNNQQITIDAIFHLLCSLRLRLNQNRYFEISENAKKSPILERIMSLKGLRRCLENWWTDIFSQMDTYSWLEWFRRSYAKLANAGLNLRGHKDVIFDLHVYVAFVEVRCGYHHTA